MTENNKICCDLTRFVMQATPEAEPELFQLEREPENYVLISWPDLMFIDTDNSQKDEIAFNGIRHMIEMNPDTDFVVIAEDSKHAMEALELHAQGYIIKPVTFEQVKNEIDYYKRRNKNAQDDKDSLYFKTDGDFECFVNGVPVRYTRTKTKLVLEYLVSKKGVMVTNDEIIRHIWGEPTNSRKSYLRSINSEIVKIFEDAGCGDRVVRYRGCIGVIPKK